MIEIEDIDLDLGGKPILRGVGFHVRSGDKAVLHGESGSGKTSLLKLLIGLHRPDRGRVTIDGGELTGEAIRAIRRCRRP